MSFDIYSEHIMGHALAPKNFGELKDALRVHVDNPNCGDDLTLYLKYVDGKVEAVSFMGPCCALATASASIFLESLKDKKLEELRRITPGDVYTLFVVPVTPARSGCVLLVYTALEKLLLKMPTK